LEKNGYRASTHEAIITLFIGRRRFGGGAELGSIKTARRQGEGSDRWKKHGP